MEYLIEYGLFLAKAITIVLTIFAVLVVLIAAGARGRRISHRGHIHVNQLNDELDHMRDALKRVILDKDSLKQEQKEKKKQEKEKRKAQQRARKAEHGKKAAGSTAQPREVGEAPEASSAGQPVERAGEELDEKAVEASEENSREKPEEKNAKIEADSRRRVYVLNFHGDIAASGVESLRQEITAVLSMARENDEVLLRLESPGGMVHSYGLASSQLARIKEKNIPLTICVDKVAASGGYMMACLADRLVAAPFAILGSIGVLVQLPNFHRVLQKHEVDYETISAGEYKTTLTTFGEITDKGREKVREDVEEMHGLFKNWVKEHRPAIDIDRIATGETWVGLQARERYMVDDIRTSDECIVEACAGADVYEVVYEVKRGLGDKIGGVLHGALDRTVVSWLGRSREAGFYS